MNFPANLKYTKEHEWILVEGNKSIKEFRQIINKILTQ